MSDLLAAWEMDEPRNYGVRDHARNFDMVTTGTIGIIPGPGGTDYGRDFSAGGRVETPYLSLNELRDVLNGSWTIECQVRPTAHVDGMLFSILRITSAAYFQLRLEVSGSGWGLRYARNTGGAFMSTAPNFGGAFGNSATDLNVWNKFALTRNGTAHYIAWNSLMWFASGVGPAITDSVGDYPVYIGNDRLATDPYPGGISNFRIWSRALSAGELWQPLNEIVTPRFTTIMRAHRFHPKTLNRRITPAASATPETPLTATFANVGVNTVRATFNFPVADSPALTNPTNYAFTPSLNILNVTRISDTEVDIVTSEQTTGTNNYTLEIFRIGKA